jgi:hypothetical protein
MMTRAAWALSVGLMLAGNAQGADSTDEQGTNLSGVVGVGVTETDNIYRTDTSQVSDAIGQVLTNLEFDDNTRLIQAKAASNLSFLEFQNDDYSSELLGNFYGTGRLWIAPDRFSWTIQENFGQQQLTPGLPATPLNLQNVNYVSTGPDLTLPVAGQLSLHLSGRFSDVSYQTSDLDNKRGDGSFAIVDKFGASSSLSANLGVESVRYQDDVTNPDFETQETYLDFVSNTARTTLSLMAGADRVSGLLNEPTQPLVRLAIEHAVSEALKLTLAAGQDYSNSGSMLRQLQELSGLSYGAAQSLTSSDPFIDRYGRVALQFDRFRTQFGFDVARYQEVHLIETQFNQVRWVADLNFRRRITPSLTLAIQGGYLDDTYSNSAADTARTLFEVASVNWQVGKRLGLQLLYQHFDQSANTSADQFRENRISAIVSYAVGRVRTLGLPSTEEPSVAPLGSGTAQH